MRDEIVSPTEGARRYQAVKSALVDIEERVHADPGYLATRTDIEPQLLAYLAEHGGPATRRAVAANRATSVHTDRFLADDEDDDVRVELARKIARLLPDIPPEELAQLGLQMEETLRKLAEDEAPRVRAMLAQEIKHLDRVPKDIVDRLAHDTEALVAVPILEYSPLLSDSDLLEIIACAKAQHVFSAIAKRSSLSGEVSDAIVASLDVPAISALLNNPSAEIREKTLESIVQSAEEIDALREPVVLRVDLSVRLVRRLASFVGYGLLEHLSTRSCLDENTREYLGARLRMRLNRPADAETSETDAIREVATAMRDGALDGAYIERNAQIGNQDVVAVGLAALSKVPLETVWRIIGSQSAKAISALVWRSGLTMRISFEIQRNIMKLPPAKCLPARNGRDFPLSEDDMRTQLSLFGA